MTECTGFHEMSLRFLAAAQEKCDKQYRAFCTNPEFAETHKPVLSLEIGQRYARIVSTSPGSRSAFGFLDRTNGDVLKSSSWKAPAKNFARGNVFDPNNGTGRVQWTGVS